MNPIFKEILFVFREVAVGRQLQLRTVIVIIRVLHHQMIVRDPEADRIRVRPAVRGKKTFVSKFFYQDFFVVNFLLKIFLLCNFLLEMKFFFQISS